LIAPTLTGLLPLLIPLLLIFVLLFLLFSLIGRLPALTSLGGLARLQVIGLLSRLGALVAPWAGLPLLLVPITLPAGPAVLLAVLISLRILVFLLTSFCVRLGDLTCWI
jgi:hypothetical protein